MKVIETNYYKLPEVIKTEIIVLKALKLKIKKGSMVL